MKKLHLRNGHNERMWISCEHQAPHAHVWRSTCPTSRGGGTCMYSSGAKCDPAEEKLAANVSADRMEVWRGNSRHAGNEDLNSNKGVLIATALIFNDQNVPARLMNINSYPVTFKRGTIGRCLSVASIGYPGSPSVASQGLTEGMEKMIASLCMFVNRATAKQGKGSDFRV